MGLKQLFRVAINAKRPGAVQFIFPVTAAEQSDAEHPGAASSQHIPGGITDYEAIDFSLAPRRSWHWMNKSGSGLASFHARPTSTMMALSGNRRAAIAALNAPSFA